MLQGGEFEASINDFKHALRIRDNVDTRINLGIALNNFATAFAEAGKIEDALKNYLQCAEYKPICNEAVRNLYSLLAQVPYLFSDFEKILIFQLSETEFEDAIINHCYRMIINLLSGNIEQFKLAHKNLGISLFENNKLNETSFDVKFATSYFNMLGQFVRDEFEFHTKDKCPKIYHLGESHSLSFTHQHIVVHGQKMTIRPRINFGAKVWHLVNTRPNRYKGILKLHVESVPKNSIVFLSFGEIDCRQDEGYLKKHQGHTKTLEQSIRSDLKKYASMISDLFSSHNTEVFIFSVPAPVILNPVLSDQDQAQISVIKFFNNTLQQMSKIYNLGYVDTYKLTANKEGFSNKIFHSDERHLSARILPELKINIKH